MVEILTFVSKSNLEDYRKESSEKEVRITSTYLQFEMEHVQNGDCPFFNHFYPMGLFIPQI
jgi:hypothetical protein